MLFVLTPMKLKYVVEMTHPLMARLFTDRLRLMANTA
jgi:hypothetical protein